MTKMNITTPADIKDQIYTIISDTAIIKRDDIADNKRFLYDMDSDSLDYLNIIMKCEKTFNIDITDQEIENTNTVGDLIELIKQKNPTQWATAQKQTRIQKFLRKLKLARSTITNANTTKHTK